MKKQSQKREIKAPIVRQYQSFIILAQSETDYKGKVQKINSGDTRGFYTEPDMERLDFKFTD